MSWYAAAIGLTASGSASVFAQTSAAPGDVVGVGGFSHIVANVERSVAFYRDVLGLEMPNPPRAFDGTPWIIDMGNTPGAQSRPAILHIPGSKLGVELIDYKDIDRKPAHPNFQGPGAASLILTVRDMDPLMAKLKEARAHINSKGGEPATIVGPNGSRGSSYRIRPTNHQGLVVHAYGNLPRKVASHPLQTLRWMRKNVAYEQLNYFVHRVVLL
jgi:catechol 2,3-dioxygenase-like lactoylglutathione lyase family enzyme